MRRFRTGLAKPHRRGATDMTRIFTYDTTLRDGSQGEGVNFSLQDKLLITQRLAELGFDYVEGGYPLSNPKDAAFFREVKKLSLGQTRVAAFGMTRRRDTAPEADTGIRALLEAETQVVTIVGKSWDLHVTEILGVSLDENVRMIADSIAYLKARGREVVYDAEHFFDGLAANENYALRTLRAASDAGASWLVLCDTNGGALPADVEKAVSNVRATIDCPIGIHTHNDGELAVANTLAAVKTGATQVQGTINGIGERCGNVDLLSVIANLALKYKGIDLLRAGSLQHLTELSRFVYDSANMNYRAGQPFVGGSAFAHKGGMHVHAVRKTSVSYEHIDPALVGNQRAILVSELSGRSNIAEKMAEYHIESNADLHAKVLERVQDLENEGYHFEAAEASFVLLVKKLANRYTPWFERLSYRVSVETAGQTEPLTEATVKVRIGEKLEHTVSEGDGPVNALDAALRKALYPHFPKLTQMSLVDYKVRVINERAGTAARVRVIIESKDEDSVWGTVGVSENIIDASWLALVDSFEHKLEKDAKNRGE
jgi:2-isopropylmalate synthase